MFGVSNDVGSVHRARAYLNAALGDKFGTLRTCTVLLSILTPSYGRLTSPASQFLCCFVYDVGLLDIVNTEQATPPQCARVMITQYPFDV